MRAFTRLTARCVRRYHGAMRAVVQRVSRAEVRVDGAAVGAIGRGLLVLVGVAHGDGDADGAWLAKKLPALRIFPDDAGKMNRSVVDIGGAILVVSQFTLCADVTKGTRPSFVAAMEPEEAERRVQLLVAALAAAVPVQTGRFRADMQVELINDGPVTIWLDSRRGDP
jgi:D-aminoacyl-tRNA deacylase